MINKAIPVLPALNIKATIMFYKDVLGFTGFDYGSYAIIKKGGVELYFELTTDRKLCESASCYIKVTDVQCLYAEMAAKSIIFPQNKLLDLPGGKKEFTLKDNNGILLRFVQQN
jgi:hypothetical protein